MKTIPAFLILLFCLATLIFAHGSDDPGQRDRCPVCGMFTSMFADWNGRILFKDGTVKVFDGAKCMFKYYLDVTKYDPARSRDQIDKVLVRDYESKISVDGRLAYYVIWSDVYGPMGHEPIPFKDESDAKEFLRTHKAKEILLFSAITPELITSLDNPP